MASLTTFGAIILAAQQRADLEGSGFITDAEWKAMTNSSLKWLHEHLVEAYGNDYQGQTPHTFTTDGTNDQYALPEDFFKLLGVDLQIGGSSVSDPLGWVNVWRFNFTSRNQYTLPNVNTLWGRSNLRYRIYGGFLWLTPLPAAGQNMRLWYAPVFTPLVNDADTYDGVNGWEELVINHVAKKALVKEESDTSGVDSLLAIELERLEHVTENRDAGNPQTIVDVQRASGQGLGGNYGDDWGC